jgi:hypothetical protein
LPTDRCNARIAPGPRRAATGGNGASRIGALRSDSDGRSGRRRCPNIHHHHFVTGRPSDIDRGGAIFRLHRLRRQQCHTREAVSPCVTVLGRSRSVDHAVEPAAGSDLPSHDQSAVFLDADIARQYEGRELHVVLDNLSTHYTDEIREWLAKNPNITFHFTPTGSSWINQIETWFGVITKQAIRRGTFGSLKQLIQTIERYIKNWNTDCEPSSEKLHRVRFSLRSASSSRRSGACLIAMQSKPGQITTH